MRDNCTNMVLKETEDAAESVIEQVGSPGPLPKVKPTKHEHLAKEEAGESVKEKPVNAKGKTAAAIPKAAGVDENVLTNGRTETSIFKALPKPTPEEYAAMSLMGVKQVNIRPPTEIDQFNLTHQGTASSFSDPTPAEYFLDTPHPLGRRPSYLQAAGADAQESDVVESYWLFFQDIGLHLVLQNYDPKADPSTLMLQRRAPTKEILKNILARDAMDSAVALGPLVAAWNSTENPNARALLTEVVKDLHNELSKTEKWRKKFTTAGRVEYKGNVLVALNNLVRAQEQHQSAMVNSHTTEIAAVSTKQAELKDELADTKNELAWMKKKLGF